MKEASYWVASHITGFFEIIDNDDPIKRGSRGAGFNLKRGSTARIRLSNNSSTTVSINGENLPIEEALVTASVIELFKKVTGITIPSLEINHDLNIPISAGFGASAAGALGTVYCLNDLFDTGLSREKLFELAHVAETTNWCGLGDISGLYQNNMTEIRNEPGAPEEGKTSSFRIDAGTRVFTCSLGSMKTSEVLNHPEHRKKIMDKGKTAVNSLLESPDVTTFMENCREFSDFIGLYSRQAKDIIRVFASEKLELPTGIMIGDGLFILTNDEKTLSRIKSNKYPFNQFREESFANETLRRHN